MVSLGTASLAEFENDWQTVVAGLLADFAFQVSAIAFVEELFAVHEQEECWGLQAGLVA